jgi:phage gp46-like protein
MPEDVKISWDEILLEGDFLYSEGDLTGDAGLETAVIISIFSDRRAEPEDELPDSQDSDRRGWWGDLTLEQTAAGFDKLGSRLWLLERAKTVPETLVKAKAYIEESLQWLVDDGIAVKVEVEVERQGIAENGILAFGVKIYKSDNDVEAFHFSEQWTSQFE